jgi:DNA-binding transcriptional LysR family regulator
MSGQESRLLDGRLKIRHLVLVQTLIQQQSIGATANALHVRQPVVTRRLRELEQILGVRLFERTSRGVTPTEFGAAFVEHARAVLAQISQAARHLDEVTIVALSRHLALSKQAGHGRRPVRIVLITVPTHDG